MCESSSTLGWDKARVNTRSESMKAVISMKEMMSLVALSLGMGNIAAAQSVSGRVTDEAGQPVQHAVVSIYTARPRVGPGVL